MLASALMMNGLITARGEKELRNHKVGKVLYEWIDYGQESKRT